MGSAKYTILGVYEKNKDLLSFLSSPISTCAFISADSFPIDKIAICFAENVSPSLAAALVQDISLSAEIRLVALENLAMKANIAVFMASLLLLVSILNFSFAYKRCIEKQIAKNKQIVKETFSSKYLREAFFRAFPYIVYLFLEYLPIVLSLFGGIYNLLYHLTYDPSLFPTSITQENLIMAIKNNINHLNISRSLVCLPVMYLQWNNRLALLVCFVSCIMSRVIKGENGNEKKHSFK